jgi:endonuclease-8
VPEGDTIHRSANRLRSVLEGQGVVRFEADRTPKPWPQAGETIDSVAARGKHLLIGFSGGLTLRTHLRMSGSWHLYRTGERWQRPPSQARAVIGTEGWDAVCFNAPDVELTRDGGAEPEALAHLGPDLTVPDADLDLCVRRMAAAVDPATPIKVALLDQRIACGVGNVYASEVPFAEGVHPAAPVASLDAGTRRRLLATANRLLVANVGGAARTTVPGGLAVYGRGGRPCRRCGTLIKTARLGEQARSTFWCPTCQPEQAASL